MKIKRSSEIVLRKSFTVVGGRKTENPTKLTKIKHISRTEGNNVNASESTSWSLAADKSGTGTPRTSHSVDMETIF
jgi:hypothetical protein